MDGFHIPQGKIYFKDEDWALYLTFIYISLPFTFAWLLIVFVTVTELLRGGFIILSTFSFLFVLSIYCFHLLVFSELFNCSL